MKKDLGNSFPILLSITNVMEHFLRVHELFDIFRAHDNITSSGTRRLINKFSKKQAFFTIRKTGLICLLLPSMADLRKQFIRLHMVFRQSLCKLKDQFCDI